MHDPKWLAEDDRNHERVAKMTAFVSYTIPEVCERIEVHRATFETPAMQRHQFVRNALLALDVERIHEGDKIEFLHDHECPYRDDVPESERPACTCDAIRIVHGAEWQKA